MGERVVESVKGQQQNTKLRDQLDNTTRLLDLRPECREPELVSTGMRRRCGTHSAFRETKRAFRMKGSLGSLHTVTVSKMK